MYGRITNCGCWLVAEAVLVVGSMRAGRIMELAKRLFRTIPEKNNRGAKIKGILIFRIIDTLPGMDST